MFHRTVSLASLLILLLATITLPGAAPATKSPPSIFPDPPSPPVPPAPPAPPPGEPAKLTPDLVYIIRSDEKLIVVASPAGVVAITEPKEPHRPVIVRGRFVDKPGEVQMRTFADKNLYFVEPLATGRCELLVWPVGAADATAVTRRLIECNVGPAPPPPGPGPVPPAPPVPTDPFYQQLVAAWFAESAATKKASRDALVKVYVEAATWNGKTMLEWHQYMGGRIKAAGLASALPIVQRAIGDELNAKLPRDPATPFDQGKVGAQMTRLAKLLEALP